MSPKSGFIRNQSKIMKYCLLISLKGGLICKAFELFDDKTSKVVSFFDGKKNLWKKLKYD